jgi:hypothetical protein
VPFRRFKAICRYLAEFKIQALSTTSSTLVNREGHSQASGSTWQNSFWKVPDYQTRGRPSHGVSHMRLQGRHWGHFAVKILSTEKRPNLQESARSVQIMEFAKN